MINQYKLSAETISRVNEILELFAKETKEVRELLASYMPAVNQLQSCHAKTFEEFALLPLAREQGDNYKKDVLYDYKKLKPACVKCGEKEKVRRRTDNKYLCSVCGKIYTANHNSIVSGSKVSSLVWMQILLSMLNFYSIKETCTICRITPTTYYKIRNRLFYAMSIMMNEVKLFGQIQVDNTFVHANYKGSDLQDKEYPDDSPFVFDSFVPRPPRSRGGHYRMQDKNLNNLCIFTAIDNYGHVMATYTGIGAASSGKLNKMINNDRFLKHVPRCDPFLHGENKGEVSKEDVDLETFVISDGEKAILHYMRKIGLPTEWHVYRRNGVQVRLAQQAHDIQKVNNLHKKLKDFIRKTNYVSAKYLPGFLTMFEFIENTNASDDAIGHLFEILATPGLGKPASYYSNLFQTPNYILEISDCDNPLKKFQDNQLYTAFLYEKFKKKELLDGEILTVKRISDITGYSPASIRRIHRNFVSSKLMPQIQKYYGTGEEDKKRRTNMRKTGQFTPEMLSVYDEYCRFRKLPYEKRKPIPDFFQEMNLKYGTSYSLTGWKHICKRIVESGLREPLPPLTNAEQGFQNILDRYQQLVASYRSQNLPLPTSEVLLNILSDETGLSPLTISFRLTQARIKKRNAVV